jgi:hypothetical protein
MLCFLRQEAVCAPDLDVSPIDPGYEVLRRMQTRSQQVYFSQNYPQRLEPLKAYVNSDLMFPYDEHYLGRVHPFGERPLVRYSDSARQNTFHLSPLVFFNFTNSTYASTVAGLGLRLFGEVTSNVTFFSRGRVYTEWADTNLFDHQFDPGQGETCSAEIKGGDPVDSRTCARFEHYIMIDLPWLDLKLGRDHLHMGPGYFSTLTAARNTPPYYMIEARIDFADWFYMDNYFLKMTDSDHNVKKYAHIHRFEFKPFKSLSVAFQDAVIYQQRDPDLIYALPLTPLAFSEDNAGGRDNDAMSFDFLYTGLPCFSLWGEVFIDDLLGPGTFFDDFWENRWAVLAGFQVVSPWRAADADLVVEYSRVEPWTYNGRQLYTSFRHFDVPSASKLGPDSRSIDLQLSYRPLKWLQLKERIEFNAKGTQYGAVLGTIHHDSMGTTKVFLKGDEDKVDILTHSLSAFWNQYVRAELFIRQFFRDREDTDFGGEIIFSW